MKRIASILLIICSHCISYAQVAVKSENIIRYTKSYTFTSDIENDPCAGAQISLNVQKLQKKLLCTITVDNKKIPGFLVKNTGPSNNDSPNLYDFYRSSSPKNIYLFIRFYKEEKVNKADIINENWRKAFKPCFDQKLITLEVK